MKISWSLVNGEAATVFVARDQYSAFFEQILLHNAQCNLVPRSMTPDATSDMLGYVGEPSSVEEKGRTFRAPSRQLAAEADVWRSSSEKQLSELVSSCLLLMYTQMAADC